MPQVITLPAGFPEADLKMLRAANADTTFLTFAPVPAGQTVPADYHKEVVSSWIDVVESVGLAVLGNIALPGIYGPLVTIIAKVGGPALKAKLTGQPTKERWTLADMAAERAAVAAVVPLV